MLRAVLVGLLMLMVSAASFGQASQTMVLEGGKEEILPVIQQAMDAEFNLFIHTVSKLEDQVGYQLNYVGLWSKKHWVSASLQPMTKGDETAVTANLITFYSNDQDHIKDLKSQIVKQIEKGSGSVKMPSDSTIYAAVSERHKLCVNRLATDPDLIQIRDKVALASTDAQTFLMKANDSVPSEAERAVIGLWATKRGKCQQLVDIGESYSPFNPVFTVVKSRDRALDQLYISLYKSTISYGQFAKYREDVVAAAKESLRKVNNEYKEKTAAARDRARLIAVEEEKAAAVRSAAIAENIKAQAAVAAASRPAAAPQSTRRECTTRAIGNTLQTECF